MGPLWVLHSLESRPRSSPRESQRLFGSTHLCDATQVPANAGSVSKASFSPHPEPGSLLCPGVGGDPLTRWPGSCCSVSSLGVGQSAPGLCAQLLVQVGFGFLCTVSSAKPKSADSHVPGEGGGQPFSVDTVSQKGRHLCLPPQPLFRGAPAPSLCGLINALSEWNSLLCWGGLYCNCAGTLTLNLKLPLL